MTYKDKTIQAQGKKVRDLALLATGYKGLLNQTSCLFFFFFSFFHFCCVHAHASGVVLVLETTIQNYASLHPLLPISLLIAICCGNMANKVCMDHS